MLADRLRQLMRQAKANLCDSGSLLPVLFIEGSDDALIGIQDLPRTATERQMLFFALGRRFASIRPRRVIAVMDAYMKADDRGLELPLERSLADDPAAGECIVVGSLDDRGLIRLLVCPYERTPRLEGLRFDFGKVQKLTGQGELYLLQAFFEGARS